VYISVVIVKTRLHYSILFSTCNNEVYGQRYIRGVQLCSHQTSMNIHN